MGLGPLGAIIGALLGGLGGGVLTGNSPFEDRAAMDIAHGDKRIQVRTPEGDTPRLNMKMDGPPGFDLRVTGKAGAAGQFEMTEAVLEPKDKAGQARRLRFNPPKAVATAKDGFVNKDAIYSSVLGPGYKNILAGTTPPPAIGTGPDAEATKPAKAEEDKKPAEEAKSGEKTGPKAAVEVRAGEAVEVKKEKTTYIIKGSDGWPMGSVVAQPNADGGKLTLVAFGPVDKDNPDKTIEPQPLAAKAAVDIKNGKVDFKDVMKAVRAGENPLKIEIKSFEKPQTLNRRDWTQKMIVEVGNGDRKKTFWVEGKLKNVKGKQKLAVDRIAEIEGQGVNFTMKSMEVAAGDLVIDIEAINRAYFGKENKVNRAKLEAASRVLESMPEMQSVFVEFSAQKDKSTVASAAPPNFSGADLGTLVATAAGGMKRGGPDFGSVG